MLLPILVRLKSATRIKDPDKASGVRGGGLISAGIIGSIDDIAAFWQRETLFEPSMSADRRESLLAGWRNAVSRVRSVDDA